MSSGWSFDAACVAHGLWLRVRHLNQGKKTGHEPSVSFL